MTIDRPRYRFSERRSNGTKITNADQELQPSVSPAWVGGQPQPDSWIGIEHSSRNSRCGRENGDPNKASQSVTIGGHRIGIASALCNLLSPRSRALSTSTVASTVRNAGDSPAQKGTKRTANMISAPNDGTTERIWEALGRMAVDSREIGLSEEC